MSSPVRVGGLAAAAAVTFCVVMMVGTAAAASTNIWPPKPDDLLWRIVLLSQGINGLGNTVTGLGIVMLVGMVAHRPLLLLVGGVTATAMSLGVLGVVLLLALDYLQFRGNLLADAVPQWDVSILGSFVLAGCAGIVLWVLGWAGVRAGRAGLRHRRRVSPAAGVVVSAPR